MGTFGGNPFGTSQFGASPGGPGFGVEASTLIYAGFRIAGILGRAGRGYANAEAADALDIYNRMIGSWNCEKPRIFSTLIQAFPLNSGKKTYTMGGPGLGADFDAARPEVIAGANLILPTSPVIRRAMRILTTAEWRAIKLQDIGPAMPYELYNDGGYPLATLYLRPQAAAGYQLELYTWQPLPRLSALTDVVVLPPGYELAIVYNLATYFATQFPEQAKMAPESWEIAQSSLAAIGSRNVKSPALRTDGAMSGDYGGLYNWLDGTDDGD